MTKDECIEKLRHAVGGERLRVKVRNPQNEWTFEGRFLGMNFTECVIRLLLDDGSHRDIDYRRILEITEVTA